MSAGVITFDGLVVDLTATPGELGYRLTPEPPHDGLFDAGAAVRVRAAGAEIPAFDVSLTGVPDLAIDSNGLVELVDGQPFRFGWVPAGDGSAIEVVLQLGWHGAPPTGVIVCRADDADGEVFIDPAVIAGFPYFSGIGLFQVPSWIARTSRATVATPGGPLAITLSSRVNLGVIHPE